MLGNLVELPSDILGDILYDLRISLSGGQVVSKEGLMEGEDALDFDAEGDLERGVDHFDGVLRIWECVVEMLIQVRMSECAALERRLYMYAP